MQPAILSSMAPRPPNPIHRLDSIAVIVRERPKPHGSPSVHWQLIWPKRRGGHWIKGPSCPPSPSSAGLNRLVVAWLGNQHPLNLEKQQGAEPKPGLDCRAGCLLTAPGKPSLGTASFPGEPGLQSPFEVLLRPGQQLCPLPLPAYALPHGYPPTSFKSPPSLSS